MMEINRSTDHANFFLAYKELIDKINNKADSHTTDCIIGTFIDPSIGVVAQNYINTIDKYGGRIYPLDFSQGILVYHATIFGIIHKMNSI